MASEENNDELDLGAIEDLVSSIETHATSLRSEDPELLNAIVDIREKLEFLSAQKSSKSELISIWKDYLEYCNKELRVNTSMRNISFGISLIISIILFILVGIIVFYDPLWFQKVPDFFVAPFLLGMTGAAVFLLISLLKSSYRSKDERHQEQPENFYTSLMNALGTSLSD